MWTASRAASPVWYDDSLIQRLSLFSDHVSNLTHSVLSDLCCVYVCVVVFAQLEAKNYEELNAHFSVQDLQDLLPREQFMRYLDAATGALVDSNPKRFTRCPKCSCPLEVDHHTWSSKSESFLVGLVGLDKTPLDEAAKAFFLSNRFLCRGCRTDFCRACKAFPFHPGLSCAEYNEFLVAPKCRFCASVVTAKTRLAEPHAQAFNEVCNSAECKEKVDQSCCIVKRCGHPCPGARDELDCPPCMYPDCEDRDPKSETREDTCSICYTEELGQAPILKLRCGHIFHLSAHTTKQHSRDLAATRFPPSPHTRPSFPSLKRSVHPLCALLIHVLFVSLCLCGCFLRACVRARLEAKWSSTRIAFEFMNCSLCNGQMQHLLLTDLLRPLFHLESQVRMMSVQRLEFEALTDHVDIVSPEGRFYQNPEGFAVNHYQFYQCYDCQEPYFAGARACGAAGPEEVKREDLICGGCQKVPSFDECPAHGSNFLIFKCRFCCNFSTFFCFGRTHFCDACHSGSVWPQLVTSAGVNLKTYDQYNQCAGIKEKVLAVTNNVKLSKEEIDAQLSHTYCDPAQCPLGVRHLPSGFEFGFGCGMCKPSEQKNSEADKLKREEDIKMKHLLREGAKEIRRWKVPDEGIIIKAAVEADIGAAGAPAPAAAAAGADKSAVTAADEEQKESDKPAVAVIAAAKIGDEVEESKQSDAAVAVGSGAEPVASPAPAVSLSLHAEAEPAPGSILGLTPPMPLGVSRPQQVVRAVGGASSSSSAKLDTVVRHNLTPDGDDLELQHVDSEGDIVPVCVDEATGGLAAQDVSDTWFHFTSKRPLAYGCHYFQFKVAQMPPPIYTAGQASEGEDGWDTAQMILGVQEESVVVPLSSVAAATAPCPLALYEARAPAFVNNGCRVDPATGAMLLAPMSSGGKATSGWRAGDIVGLLVDLDQPGGVQLGLYKNGFEVDTRAHGFTALNLNKPAPAAAAGANRNGGGGRQATAHVKIVASFRGGAGYHVSLSDLNFVDRALWRFEVDNALPAESRMPRGASSIPILPQQNAATHKLRWMPLLRSRAAAEVIEVPAADDVIAEGDEDEDDEEKSAAGGGWLFGGGGVDLGEGHHDPSTLTLKTSSNYMCISELECWYGPGGDGQVINLQASAALPIWGESRLQYWELTVQARGQLCAIGMGLAQKGYPGHRMPGWDRFSYGYHGDDGKKFLGPTNMGNPYGPVWRVGDVIGMCIDRAKKEIFYTVNGAKLPVAFRDVDINATWLPTIGMHSEGEKVKVNFKGPFAWKFLEAFPFNPKKGARVVEASPVRQRLDAFFSQRQRQEGIAGARVQYMPAGLQAVPRAPPMWAAPPQAPLIGAAPRLPVPDRMLDAPRQQQQVQISPIRRGGRIGGGFGGGRGGMQLEVAGRGALLADLQQLRGGPRRVSFDVGANAVDAAEAKQPEVGVAAPEAKVEEDVPEEFREFQYPPGPWACDRCTFINEPIAMACSMCATARPRGVQAAPAPPAPAPAPAPPAPPAPAANANPMAPPSPPQLFGGVEEQKIPEAPPLLSVLQRHFAAPAQVPLAPPPPAAAAAVPAPAAPIVPQAPPMGFHVVPAAAASDLDLLPTALLRGFSDPEDGQAEMDAVTRVKDAAALAAALVKARRDEQEREDRAVESQCEFDGVKHRDLILELQGSSALCLDVPLAPAPKGAAGMERFGLQMKEPLKAYTLLLDMMLPKGQLHEAPAPAPAGPLEEWAPPSPNPNLRYFPLFDVATVVPMNDPMAVKAFFVHPSGVIGALQQSQRKDPDPVLLPHEWSRVAIVVDLVRERFEVYIDGLQSVHSLGNNFKAQGEKIKVRQQSHTHHTHTHTHTSHTSHNLLARSLLSFPHSLRAPPVSRGVAHGVFLCSRFSSVLLSSQLAETRNEEPVGCGGQEAAAIVCGAGGRAQAGRAALEDEAPAACRDLPPRLDGLGGVGSERRWRGGERGRRRGRRGLPHQQPAGPALRSHVPPRAAAPGRRQSARARFAPHGGRRQAALAHVHPGRARGPQDSRLRALRDRPALQAPRPQAHRALAACGRRAGHQTLRSRARFRRVLRRGGVVVRGPCSGG